MSIAASQVAPAIIDLMNTQRLQEHRIERLQALVQREGGKAALGRRLGYRDGAFIGQMLRGERPISEKTVFLVENLPGYRGWFNHPNDDYDESYTITDTGPKLPESLGIVAAALRRADDLTLDQVRPLLTRMVDTPERSPEIVPRLAALLA